MIVDSIFLSQPILNSLDLLIFFRLKHLRSSWLCLEGYSSHVPTSKCKRSFSMIEFRLYYFYIAFQLYGLLFVMLLSRGIRTSKMSFIYMHNDFQFKIRCSFSIGILCSSPWEVDEVGIYHHIFTNSINMKVGCIATKPSLLNALV